ncbi:MAG: hypothetical protein E6J18_04460 [Chloroflexi bacterium]|nr:MAG: hypothetical protein E6J18_04460 [Chloroflexota bacterium]
MRLRKVGLTWALAGAALLASALLPAATALAAFHADDTLASTSDESGTPSFTTEGSVTDFQTSRTIPYWSSSFTDPTNQVEYPFTMVGSDPRLGGSTTVATEIIPLTFNFVAGDQDVSVLNVPARNYVAVAVTASMDAGASADATIASPIFTPSTFSISGDAAVQYGDAVMRAQFGQVGTGYHVVLDQPAVLDAASIDVPESKGVAVNNPLGVLVGRIDEKWFRAHLHKLLGSLHIDSTTLPIFLTKNVFVYRDGDYLACCGLGGHGAGSTTGNGGGSINGNGNQAVQTYVWAAYITPNSFPRFPAPYAGLSDIHSLSHEIAEWMTNPFGINTAQSYLSPLAPPTAPVCSALLESGDPVTGLWFPMAGNPDPAARGVWHPEDVVFLNWFARDGQDAALAPADGRYTYMGHLTTMLGGPFLGFGILPHSC